MKKIIVGIYFIMTIGCCTAMQDENNVQFTVVDSSNAADFSDRDAFLEKTVKFNFDGIWNSKEVKLNTATADVWNPVVEGHKKIIMARDEQKQDFDFLVIDSLKLNDDCIEIDYYGFDLIDEKRLGFFIDKLKTWQDRPHEIVMILDVHEVDKLKNWLSNNYFFEETCNEIRCWASPKTFKRSKISITVEFLAWP